MKEIVMGEESNNEDISITDENSLLRSVRNVEDMSKWGRYEEEGKDVIIRCQRDGREYRIIGEKVVGEDGKEYKNIILVEKLDDTHSKYLKELDISVLLFEWDEYDFEIENESDGTKVLVGDNELPKRRGRYKLQFQNQLGKVVIRVRMGEREIELPEIEVISRKLWDSPIDELFYPTFYKNLVDSLTKHCLSLSFHILAPTYLRAEEALHPPSLFFKFHYFKRNWKEIMEAYNTIVYQPYKRLIERDNFVRISQVKAIDGSVIHDIITHSERWEKVETQSSIPLAKKLGNRLPTIVLQREKYETYDVPENRFAKFFLQMLLNELSKIMREYERYMEDKDEFKEVKENFETLRDFLMYIQTMDVFVEAGEMRIFPANSTVLQKRDGYRELLKLYREFQLSYCPLFDKIEEALAARDIATLYEYWCFFEIGKALGEVFSENKKEPTLFWDATGGLEAAKSYFEFKHRDYTYKLVYNKKFGRGRNGSYSVPLRPDFSLVRERKDKNGRKEIATIVFDAKFRFDEKYVEGKLGGDKAIDEESENEMRRGNFERAAKLDDIFKMHTYKDALHLSSAFIVFPGTKRSLFEDKKEESEAKKAEKIKRFRGIGYIPLVPGRDDKDLKEVVYLIFLGERLEELLKSEELHRLALEWKEGKSKDIRESYLYLAGEAHKRLEEKTAHWLKNEGRLDHKRFDEEFLGPLYLWRRVSKPVRAWDEFICVQRISKDELIGMMKKDRTGILKGNPIWKLDMSLLTSPEQPAKEPEILRQLSDEEKDELAREFLGVFGEETDVGEKYKKIDKICKDAIKRAKEMRIDGAAVSMGPSRFSSILHIFKPEEYIHIDECFLRALGKVGGKELRIDEGLMGILNEPENFAIAYPILNDFAKKLVERLELQNLCDLYWFLIAIDENIVCDKF